MVEHSVQPHTSTRRDARRRLLQAPSECHSLRILHAIEGQPSTAVRFNPRRLGLSPRRRIAKSSRQNIPHTSCSRRQPGRHCWRRRGGRSGGGSRGVPAHGVVILSLSIAVWTPGKSATVEVRAAPCRSGRVRCALAREMAASVVQRQRTHPVVSFLFDGPAGSAVRASDNYLVRPVRLTRSPE
jgi:hypothetical protein